MTIANNPGSTTTPTLTGDLPRLFVYFVAFAYTWRNGGSTVTSHSNDEVIRAKVISSHADIIRIEEELMQGIPHAETMAVLNWKLLRMEDASTQAPPAKPTFQAVSDSEGPFTVMTGDSRLYSALPSFRKACVIAEASAQSSNNEPCFVLNEAGQKVAGYLHPDASFFMYAVELEETPNSFADLEAELETAACDTWTLGSREELVSTLARYANRIATTPSEMAAGIRVFEVDADHRIVDLNPRYLAVFHQFNGKFVMADGLPDDLRQAVEHLVK